MPRKEIYGRIVESITSDEGQLNYYEHLNFWRTWYDNTNKAIVPTKEETDEYLLLKEQSERLYCHDDVRSRSKLRKLRLYDTRYDWRPRLSETKTGTGLVSPTGEVLLPPIFFDVFREFDAINNRPAFVPVSNGEAWGLATLSAHPVMTTDFQYNAIMLERWENRMFFVQDKETMKWGALAISYPFSRTCPFGDSLPALENCMPTIADEIYEDELMTDDAPTTFFMTRKGNRVGILTPFGHSDIVYDSYIDDPADRSFRLIRDSNTVFHKRTFWHPSGNR